jgi:hypothetical protein
MSLKTNFILFTSVMLGACGGGSTDNGSLDTIEPPPPPPPVLVIPKVSGINPFPSVEADILVSDNLIFIADGVNRLRAFQLTDGALAEISISGDEDNLFAATRLSQKDSTIFVKGAAGTQSGGQLRLFDITSSSNVTRVGDSTDFSGFGGLYVFNEYVLSGGSFGQGISIYRLNTSSNIELVANEPVSGPVSDIVGRGNIVYAISQKDILIYTISPDGTLTYNGIFPVTISAYKVQQNNELLFYSDDNRAKVLDISDSFSPVQIFESVDKINSRQVIPVKYCNNHMYAGGSNVVQVYKNTNNVFEKIGTIQTENVVSELACINENLIVINSPQAVSDIGSDGGPSSIEIFDISSLN